MNKKVIFIISLLTFMSVFNVSFAFSDIENHWASEMINEYKEYKFILGYDDNLFKPDNNMTRAEFVTVINKILGADSESAKYIPDISRDDWYYHEIRKAVKLGIIQGDDLGYIRPNDLITREEATIILTRAFKIKNAYTIKTNAQDAYQISKWARGEFYAVVNYGYITGYEDNTLRPQNTITRAEVITIISRIIPNILPINIYSGEIKGNTLVYEDNTVLTDLVIDGSLFISNDALKTLNAKNVKVAGDLIVSNKEKSVVKNIKTNGVIYEFTTGLEELITYQDDEYGIRFTIPESVVMKKNEEENINYKLKDLLVISADVNDEYYLKSVESIARTRAYQYDNIYELREEGTVDGRKYVLYADYRNQNMLVIARDNVVYEIRFFNIESENLVDNVLSTIEFFETELVKDCVNRTYKNSKLGLKFVYKDKFIAVDDSYNTGIINEEESFFKLIVQVNTITDMHKYTLDEIKEMLALITSEDGEIIEENIFRVMNNNAIKFKVLSEEKTTNSLFVIIGNNLYNLIFVGETNDMNEVGDDLFNTVINSLEF